MKKTMQYLCLLCCLAFTNTLWAQCTNIATQKAQNAFNAKKYQKAIGLWQKAKNCSDCDDKCKSTINQKIATAQAQITAAKNKNAEKPIVKPSVKKTEPTKPPIKKPATFIPSNLKMEMVFVQGGTFQMGSNDSEADSDEKPVHNVTLSSFYIGKYEVTQKQWRVVMGDNPSYFKNCDECPVENVSWEDVQAFIGKLNSLTGKRYRLPTEAEWEYAARGGNKSRGYKYSGSNNLDEVGWYDNNSSSKTQTIHSKRFNELGVYDMSGNVWEWCSDWYDAKYYSSSATVNPIGAATGSWRVLRGGSWYGSAAYSRCANRSGNYPTNRYNHYGFRVLLILQ